MELETRLLTIVEKEFNKEISSCSKTDIYHALLILIKEELQNRQTIQGERKLYYFSAEFLIGKLLSNNLINLGLYDEVSKLLAAKGFSLAEIEEIENEPSLGNGGLGRLAACFLDSLASLDLPGDGIGLNYHLGLFKQEFIDKQQIALANPWINHDSWLNKTEFKFKVNFKGLTLDAILYDLDVIGYNGQKNKLHLFDLVGINEDLVKDGISFDKRLIEQNLTLFLYPDDSDDDGKKLRLYQQYFMVSAGGQYILQELKSQGRNIRDLAKYVTIQINDTHPSLIIPELIRLLMLEGINLKDAVDIVSATCAYTNHTILAEALEKWPISYLEEIVPHLLPIIQALDAIANQRSKDKRVQIIDDYNLVHMAHMDIHFGYSINGVAAIHTQILKDVELKPFYDLYPDKFNNKTNGITFRRWLLSCNHELTNFIDKLIGCDYKKDADKLEELLKYQDDLSVLEELLKIKRQKKEELVKYILEKEGLALDADSIFDIQIKRLHEYKRQQMNLLYIIYKYLEIKKGNLPSKPITFIFGAKAAPAYELAKDIIHLALCLQELISNDSEVNKYIKVVMVTNYNVTYAQKLFPAADVSEQISLASKEASGTGNMKFMLNGAVTLGTDDGANVEIHELVGDENIYIFGTKSDQVISMIHNNSYHPNEIFDNDSRVREILDFIISDKLIGIGDGNRLNRLYHELRNNDRFMALLDLNAYIQTKDQLVIDYVDSKSWAKKMLINIAKAGFFSSDRTIGEYNNEIWRLK